MLPPVDQDIRTANPKFDALYNDLCNNKLNPDGSTKLDAKAQRERDTLNEVCRIYSSEIISRNSSPFILIIGLMEMRSYLKDMCKS